MPGYDYASAGAYFVTVCTARREPLLGKIIGAEARLTESGKAAAECWQWLAERYPFVQLDAWVIMPNHLHGVLLISDGTKNVRRKNLGGLVGAFKTVSTQRINATCGSPGQVVWQRNYYEHIIRNEGELLRIRQYIVENPMRWDLDRENPTATPPQPVEPWEV